MNPTIDILRAELERLFSLDEMTSMSERLLGLDPKRSGGATAKASFAHALTERCLDGDRIDALVDVILVSRQGVDPRVRTPSALLGKEELPRASSSAPSPVLRKLGESELAIVYTASRRRRKAVARSRSSGARPPGQARGAAVPHREPPRRRRRAPGPARGLEAGETDGRLLGQLRVTSTRSR